ncbi:MAG: rod shape-determining protein RodA [Chitinophagales bacterium]|nr:rod shape-determining protein RodA [Chitinophagales bacterium]MDW8393910.1 rod shape-determining protein RodA [Chitinophagales bacterium]
MTYYVSRRPNQGIDWLLIGLVVTLMVIGVLAVFSSGAADGHFRLLDLTQMHGRQLLWMLVSLVVAGVIVLVDSKVYTVFAYAVYGVMMVLLLLVFVFGVTVRGDTNWLVLGPVRMQPSEFAKFATALALAKLMGSQNFNIRSLRQQLLALAILGLPAVLVLLQGDAGSAIVFASYALVMYRFGLSAGYLLAVVLLVALSLLTVVMDPTLLVLILFALGALVLIAVRKNRALLLTGAVALLLSVGYVFASGYVFEHMLEPHQQDRIRVLLGQEAAARDADYNVRQSKIAIGSGGFWGKGFLNGTLTRYNFVPEQSTDFIFCTIGEEFGFWGSTLLLLLFLALILRILFIAQRQRSRFSMIYAYCVASVLFFHLFINIGMTIGLMPVIGIPLPFISYGGSSLLSFTILVFILVKLDGDRLAILR